MNRIYISGRITGLSYREAETLFKEAQEYLSLNYDCVVVNPMNQVPYNEKWKWEDYMIEDIKLLFHCDSIFMLTGWEMSKGARIECSIAKEMSKNIIFQENEK